MFKVSGLRFKDCEFGVGLTRFAFEVSSFRLLDLMIKRLGVKGLVYQCTVSGVSPQAGKRDDQLDPKTQSSYSELLHHDHGNGGVFHVSLRRNRKHRVRVPTTRQPVDVTA